MTYDSARARVVLFGGVTNAQDSSSSYGLLNDTWEWDGNDWAQVSTPTSPPVLRGPQMVFDASRGVTVLHKGWTAGWVWTDH